MENVIKKNVTPIVILNEGAQKRAEVKNLPQGYKLRICQDVQRTATEDSSASLRMTK